MEEIITKSIILNSKDYGENDKLAVVFSLEYGKISLKFNGVRKQKAKLKPLIQPFSLVEVECFKRGDFFTVKTGSVIDNFPKITTDYTRTICGYILMDIINKVLPKNKVETEIFMSLANSLEKLETFNPYIVTIQFITKFFELIGETLITDLDVGHIYLDLDMGNFTSARTPNSIEIDKRCYKALTEVNENDSINKMTLKMLNNIFKAKYDIELASFSFL